MPAKPIVVDGVSKLYTLGDPHDAALKERLESLVRAPARLFGRGSVADGPDEEVERDFWALRDVSLEVEPGEVLGLIGANGAGKSTLLKILSRITLPTEGRVTMRGRVGSLLEVGTGFHPELSGADNIYLNGSILGMRRREIDRIYDEIVEFSGISRFIDTPVKRYSSGMFVRLAFSVAAHLRTDILLVDEVLSVGDAAFQRKSLGKMDAAASEGRTVVFVSHSHASVQRLCTRAVLMEKGRLAQDGPTEEVISNYLERSGDGHLHRPDAVISADVERYGSGEARLRAVEITNQAGERTETLHMGQFFRVSATFEVFEDAQDAVFEVGISNMDGQQILTTQTIDFDRPPLQVPRGLCEVSVDIEAHLLPHEYIVAVGMHRTDGTSYDLVLRARAFKVENSDEAGGDRYPWQYVRGYIRPRATWNEVPSTVARSLPSP